VSVELARTGGVMNGRSRVERAAERIWYGGSPWRWPLVPVSLAYRAAVALRARLYRSGVKPVVRLPVPVVVVGNVTAGGTGKTPLVIWLAERLAARGRSPGIVSRGYGGRAAHWPQRVRPDSSPDLVGDEPVLIATRTRCPVFAGPDRVAAARALLAEADVDVVLADDGLQHYRLARTFEIAVVDGARGLGNGWCLPAGPLREPAARLDTVDAVVVNGAADDVSAALGSAVSARAIPMRLALHGVYRVVDGEAAALEDFIGCSVHAVAGIGHPERFFRALEQAGLTVLRHPLPDHARIAARDLPRDGPVLVTEKDAVKLREIGRDDVFAVAVDAVLSGVAEGALLDAIDAAFRAAEAESEVLR